MLGRRSFTRQTSWPSAVLAETSSQNWRAKANPVGKCGRAGCCCTTTCRARRAGDRVAPLSTTSRVTADCTSALRSASTRCSVSDGSPRPVYARRVEVVVDADERVRSVWAVGVGQDPGRVVDDRCWSPSPSVGMWHSVQPSGAVELLAGRRRRSARRRRRRSPATRRTWSAARGRRSCRRRRVVELVGVELEVAVAVVGCVSPVVVVGDGRQRRRRRCRSSRCGTRRRAASRGDRRSTQPSSPLPMPCTRTGAAGWGRRTAGRTGRRSSSSGLRGRSSSEPAPASSAGGRLLGVADHAADAVGVAPRRRRRSRRHRRRPRWPSSRRRAAGGRRCSRRTGAPTGAWQLMQVFAAESKSACCVSPSWSASFSFSASVTGSCASMIVPVWAWAIDDSFHSWTMSSWQSAQVFDATKRSCRCRTRPGCRRARPRRAMPAPDEQDRDDRVQGAPRLELQHLRALTALAREVLLDLVGHLPDLAPDDLLARVELGHLGLDLGERQRFSMKSLTSSRKWRG